MTILCYSEEVERCQKWSNNITQQIDLAFNIFFMVYFFIRVSVNTTIFTNINIGINFQNFLSCSLLIEIWYNIVWEFKERDNIEHLFRDSLSPPVISCGSCWRCIRSWTTLRYHRPLCRYISIGRGSDWGSSEPYDWWRSLTSSST